jgi:FAD/FMN-containing dehydrogenase
VLIPYGGGSNIAGSLQAPEDETRPVISVDLGRLNQLIDIDEESGLARIQAGAQGRTWRSSSAPAAGRWDITQTVSPTALSAAG